MSSLPLLLAICRLTEHLPDMWWSRPWSRSLYQVCPCASGSDTRLLVWHYDVLDLLMAEGKASVGRG